jgi:hypothetical protein
MQRRTKAILLIVFALLVIVGVVIWILLPLKQAAPTTFTQPPGYADGQAQTEPLPVEPGRAAPAPADPAQLESRRLEDKLRRFAEDFTSRAGSYSNADGFAALREAGLEATPKVRSFFASEQARLSAAYPLRSGHWGQTTRGLASKITSVTPIRSQTEVTVQVDAQIITEVGDASPVTGYRHAILTLQKTDGRWLVSRLDWVDEQ